MNKMQYIGAAAIAVMLVVCAGAGMRYNEQHAQQVHCAYTQPLAPAPQEENPTAGIDVQNNYEVSDDFSTHLPLVILELEEGEPPITVMWNSEINAYENIPGLNEYVSGTFHLIENETGINSAGDTPVLSSLMNIRRRGYSSRLFEKAQWKLEFLTESGQDNDLDILGMGAEHEWILNGSLADKSMLRNYLAYSIASEFMPYTPDFYFCEVLIRKDGVLYYQGVYLLGENIKQGENRVNISRYQSGQLANSYLVRRERIDPEGCMLDTFGRLNGYASEYIGMVYPTKTSITPDMKQYVEKDLNEIEKVLYATDDSLFRTYPTLINVDSFVDYFILNEFFNCYDAGNNSTYIYKERGGKLCMGPVWDFDGAIDNYPASPMDTGSTGLNSKPWFDQLCTDKAFVRQIMTRYTQLRKTSLSDQHIMQKIQEIVAHLGGAQEREWLRWNSYYTENNANSPSYLLDYEQEDGTVLHRNTETFADELYRIKTMLRDHGQQIPEALLELEATAQREPAAAFQRSWLLLLFAALFLIPSVWVAFRR